MSKRFQVGLGTKHDVPAAPAVTTVRPAPRDVFFPSKRDRTGSAGAGMHGDCDFVDELLHPLSAGRSYRDEPLSLSALELDVSVDL